MATPETNSTSGFDRVSEAFRNLDDQIGEIRERLDERRQRVEREVRKRTEKVADQVTSEFKKRSEKLVSNIQRYGNCSAGSIPMLLDECVRGGRIGEGDLIAMAGFGSGFTWGAALIRW